MHHESKIMALYLAAAAAAAGSNGQLSASANIQLM